MMLQIFAPVNWAETLATSKPAKRSAEYVVRDGDTLAGIALRWVRWACLNGTALGVASIWRATRRRNWHMQQHWNLIISLID